MMDAVKYLKERERMCDSYNNMCDGCGFGKVPKCNRTEEDNPEKAVEIVEKWSSEHPKKTRQSELLKMFPNAELSTDGILTVAPCLVDKTFNRSAGNTEECCIKNDCIKCRKEYWLAEVAN